MTGEDIDAIHPLLYDEFSEHGYILEVSVNSFFDGLAVFSFF